MPAIVQIIVVLVLLGLALWVISQFPALDATIVKLIRIIVIVVAVLLTLNALVQWIWGVSVFSGVHR